MKGDLKMILKNIGNIITNISDSHKNAFNKKCDGYQVRLCNSNNLVVYALKDNGDLLIYPTPIAANDIVVDVHNNRYFIKEVIDSFVDIETKNGTESIKVYKLKVDNTLLKNMFISTYLIEIDSRITNSLGDINGDNNIINISSEISNSIDLDINEYWKKLRNELVYRFDQRQTKPIVDEIDEAISKKITPNEEKIRKSLSKIFGWLRECVLDFLAKYAAEMTKTLM
jgi:hypothetical protein